ncbi:MAG TPA: sterol desaturase family protein [Bacteroidia bacterium]|jgi:sterol desaturase/sphingolipid hydroxylase (fatty acid hydroxylase superfamily)|nr:sterol desaturase family protein [Bacteroidia bacterium]
MEQKFVSNSQESTRMFKSNFLELFSKIHFVTPLILFVPVVTFFIYKSIFVFHLGIVSILLLIAAGIFVWSLTEYLMHRFLFHYHPTSSFGKRLHFVFHGVHHDYPNDAKRLVMAPAVSIPLAFLYYYLFRFLIGEQFVAPFFSGFVSGYLFYDMTHYAIHHLSFKNGLWMRIKKHHMIHHYKDDDHGYGVSSKFWDIIFRTDFEEMK